MADAEFGGDIESFTVMVEQLGETFVQLEAQRDSLSSYLPLWEEIKEHLHNRQASLKKKFVELQKKISAFEEKKSKSDALIAEKKLALAEKELAMLDSLQELKDAAVAEIREAHKKYGADHPEPNGAVGSKQNKVSTSKGGHPSEQAPALGKKSFGSRSGNSVDAVAAEVELRPQLVQLCQQMDATQLLNFLSENKKILSNLREDISIALKSATDPAQLVLNSLKSFYPMEHISSSGKDTVLQGLRRTCLVLMESAAPLLGTGEPGDGHPLSSDVKQQAKAIADDWKVKLANMDLEPTRGFSLETLAFLQLLVTFQIINEFDQDELCKLVLAVSRRKQTPDLCRALGLTQRIPGIIEALVNHRRHIDAVHFVHAFELTESFPPVPLLKAYLNEVINVQTTNLEEAGAKDVTSVELGALRVVIKCIEEYSLQSEYPIDPLQKQVTEIEKAKADKKRKSDAAKSQFKRSRLLGAYPSRTPPVASQNRQPISLGLDDGGLYHGGLERYPYSVAAPPPGVAPSYNYQIYTRSSYGSQNPQANVHRPYQYGDWAPSSSFIGGSGAGSALPGYGSYYNSGLSSDQSYK